MLQDLLAGGHVCRACWVAPRAYPMSGLRHRARALRPLSPSEGACDWVSSYVRGALDNLIETSLRGRRVCVTVELEGGGAALWRAAGEERALRPPSADWYCTVYGIWRV